MEEEWVEWEEIYSPNSLEEEWEDKRVTNLKKVSLSLKSSKLLLRMFMLEKWLNYK
jgi:hypothetical protein